MIDALRLKALHLFSEVDSALLERLAQTMLEKTFSKGEVIIKEG